MAHVYPFRAWHYTPAAGPVSDLATQPYDTIPPRLAAHYRALHPHNLVHLILPQDGPAGAARRWQGLGGRGVLAQAAAPAFFVYEQSFPLPETGERLVRRGFIGLGDLEQYGSTVHRHERTLNQPKADRLDLLTHTRAHLESLFLLYPDPAGEVDALLDTTGLVPHFAFTDIDSTAHTLWRIADPARATAIQVAMRDRPLLIADGHHRYEAALEYRRAHPGCAAARRALMTFVRLESPGLRSLAAHRLVSDLAAVPAGLLTAGAVPLSGPGQLAAAWQATPPGRVRFGLALHEHLWLLEFDRPAGALNLAVLYRRVLAERLGITPEAIAAGRYLRYCRGVDRALAAVRDGAAQLALLVEPLRVDEVARMAFAGDILPQKSTDFYPKLASGLCFYSLQDDAAC